MSTRINSNSSVVNVGRTTPVSPGQQPASRSIPVVLASDQQPIPVEEQNKVQSEVSLSLLGIPRAEVALGIFADVNTYDVNPSEWSSSPAIYTPGSGIKHLPNEAGALVEAPRDRAAVLTSKRFFRYQPGRVSAATFGVKATVSTSSFAANPVIRKYGIFDNFDGYYWEHRQNGQGDNFSVVRRTQSLLNFPNSPFGNINQDIRKHPNFNDQKFITKQQTDDYRVCGRGYTIPKGDLFVREREVLLDQSIKISETAFAQALANTTWTDSQGETFADNYGLPVVQNDETRQQYVFREKCKRDVAFWIDMFVMDLEWGGDAHTKLNTKNYRTALVNKPEVEAYLHNFAKNLILDYFTIGSDAYTKLDTLTDITITLFSQPTPNDVRNYWQTACATIDWGNKERLDTVFDSRKHYWSYFVSTYSAGELDVTGAGAYSNSSVQDTSGLTNVKYRYQPELSGLPVPTGLDALVGQFINPYQVEGDASYSGLGVGELSAEQAYYLNKYYDDIRYRCVRDTLYVIDGYKNDIIGGGNAETKYNMSMYYRGDGQSIYTQSQDGSPLAAERSRHSHLRDLILEDLKEVPFNMDASSPIEAKIKSLSADLIDNFNTESTIAVEYGTRGFAGNLIAFRDGLPMIHAAVNDPTLLKPKKRIKAYTKFQDLEGVWSRFEDWTVGDGYSTVFTLTEGIATIGQKVRMYTGNGQDWQEYRRASDPSIPTQGGWKNGALFKVAAITGPTGKDLILQTYRYADAPEGQPVLTVDPENGRDFTVDTNDDGENYVYLELVQEFEVPEIYDPQYYRFDTRASGTVTDLDGQNESTNYDDESDPFIQGMQFPLRYSSNIQLDDAEAVYLGYIDTTLDPNVNSELSEIRRQYDNINFVPEYINWVKNNVKPEYWGVYEYRVPRSRFSHDKLDGTVGKRVYSDVATGPTGIVRPGMNVLDEDGLWEDAESLYNFDFTKVTMLKVEFSWYGAVGALFLAYVPVDNGEARWVRVHHLRASNQLKIASLGNATLPITYNVWGGGSRITGGDLEFETDTYNYGTASHHIVKYGASYYIDGGDRGTVRLYSHNNNAPIDAIGKKWRLSAGDSVVDAQYEITQTQTTDGINVPADKTFFMGADLQTNDPRDSGIKVDWVNGSFIEFTRQPVGSGITLLTDRASVTYGLETKDVITSAVSAQGVRNRVQVYPTKLSTANLGNNPVRLRMKKTPIFQTTDVVSGDLTLTADYTISADVTPLTITESDAPFLLNNAEKYGWFKARVLGESITVFGRLYKVANEYYFDLFDSFTDTVTLTTGKFLPDERFGYQANTVSGKIEVVNYSDTTRVVLPSQDTLTSINVLSQSLLPIPLTGTNVATLYLVPGTEQVELNTYFDYNKEYLSFPLTDEVESLYIAIDSDTLVGENTDPIAVGITWEEQ